MRGRCRIAPMVAVVVVACSGGEPAIDCEQAVDAALVVYARQPLPQSATPIAAGRAQSVLRCERRWDAIQRRCVIGATDLTMLAACQLAADRRHHPEWQLPP